MKLTLEVKKKCSFFWLRAIRIVRIDKCCAKCFIGHTFHEVYEATRFKHTISVDLAWGLSIMKTPMLPLCLHRERLSRLIMTELH